MDRVPGSDPEEPSDEEGQVYPRISPRCAENQSAVPRALAFASTSVGSSFSDSFLFFSSGFGSLRAREANEAGESTEAGEGSSGVLISHVSVSLTKHWFVGNPSKSWKRESRDRNEQRQCGQMKCKTEGKRSQPLYAEPRVRQPREKTGYEFIIFQHEVLAQWKSLFCLRLTVCLGIVEKGVPKSGYRFQIAEIGVPRFKFPVKLRFGIWMKSC